MPSPSTAGSRGLIKLCPMGAQTCAVHHLQLNIYHAKENLASAKIVKTEFNANLDLAGFPIL